jgi:hypothetical protein
MGFSILKKYIVKFLQNPDSTLKFQLQGTSERQRDSVGYSIPVQIKVFCIMYMFPKYNAV